MSLPGDLAPLIVIARAIALTIPCLPHSLRRQLMLVGRWFLSRMGCLLARSSRQGRAIFRRSQSFDRDCSRNRADNPLSSSLASQTTHVGWTVVSLSNGLPARSLVQTGARDFPTLAIV